MNNAITFEALLNGWNNADKAQAINKLKASMSETATRTSNHTNVEQYIKQVFNSGCDGAKFPDYPQELSSTSRSTFYKDTIKDVAQSLKVESNLDVSTPALFMAWENCEKSKSLAEFRKSLKMYLTILRTNTYTDIDLLYYTNQINALDDEIKSLKESKRQNEEIFGIMQEDDESLMIALKTKKLKENGLTDTQVAKVLGITRSKLFYHLNKIEFQ